MGLNWSQLNSGFYLKRRMNFVFCFFLFLNFSPAQSFLDEHFWQHRVLLIFAPNENHVSLQTQITLLTQKKTEVTERDLLFYKIFAKNGVTPQLQLLSEKETIALRKKFNIEEHQYVVILIGKDGKEKLRRWEIVMPQEIFELIDAMPMRQAEMSRKNN